MVGSRLSIVFFEVGILDKWLAGFGEDFADFPLGCRRFDLSAGDVEVPVVAVVEEKQHAFAFLEDLFNDGSVDAGFTIVLDVFHVGEQSIEFLAVEGVPSIVVKPEGMVEIEANGIDDVLSQPVQIDQARDGDDGFVAVGMFDSEGVGVHEVRFVR